MDESRLPRQLLVSALPSGKRSVGGQKCRWNDLLVRDLKSLVLEMIGAARLWTDRNGDRL